MVPLARDRSLARAVRWVPALIALATLGTYVAIVWHFTPDDTYITLRYSRNLARGLGAVYNTSGPRGEGYTSLLWMLLLALPQAVGANALVAAKAAGVAATVGTCAVIGLWTFRDSSQTPARWAGAGAAVIAYAALPATAVHAVSGMETALYTLLFTSTLFAACRVAQGELRWTWPFALLGLAATLARPEAALAVVVSAAAALTTVPRPARRRLVVTLALGCGLPLIGVELFRLRYYGLPLPLPFYVKVTLTSWAGLPGMLPVVVWLATLPRLALPLLVLFVARPLRFRPAFATALAMVVFFLLPQHLMGYSSRYLAPLDPLLCVWFGAGVVILLEGRAGSPVPSSPPSNRRSNLGLALAALSLLLVVAEGVRDARHMLRQRLEYRDRLAAAHERLGRELAAAHLGDARLAISDAGAVPYLSDLWTLDLVGLNEPRIALTHSRDPRWILSLSPDVLVLVSTEPDQFVTSEWNDYEWPLFQAATARGFRRVGRRRFAVDYWLWVLARPDGPAAHLSLTE